MIINLKKRKQFFTILWFLLPAITGFLKWKRNSVNNYYIFKGVIHHLINETNLYGLYPNEYSDCNHYGPVFSLIIAPFAYIPDYVAVSIWLVFQAFVLYNALMILPIKINYKWILLAICIVDLNTSSCSSQINPTVAGMIILSWYYVKKEQVIWAAFFIILGTLIKLYGIVGLAFWLFSNQKIKFIGYLILWIIILLVLPMLISSPNFIIQSYLDWYESIIEKNNLNKSLANGFINLQDISIMGVSQRVFGLRNVSNLIFIIPGFLLQILPLIRYKIFNSQIFQLRYLASLLIFVVIFSTSSESPTYIIAVSGVAIWFVSQEFPSKKWIWLTLGFVLIFTSISATDLFPVKFAGYFLHYSLKAIPCILVWFICISQLISVNFSSITTKWVKV